MGGREEERGREGEGGGGIVERREWKKEEGKEGGRE